MGLDTNAVAMIGRILTHVASDDPCTAADLARRLGTARTTTFHVLRRLENAGFVDRDPHGLVSPGVASADLGFAAFGIVKGAGAAEALLSILRDAVEASVELAVLQGRKRIVLARRTASGSAGHESGLGWMEETVWVKEDITAVLRVAPRASSRAADREAIGRCLKSVADALAHSFAQAE